MLRRAKNGVKNLKSKLIATVGQQPMSTSRINPPYKGVRKTAEEMYPLFPVTPKLEVPSHIIRPPYAMEVTKDTPSIKNHKVEIKSPEEIARMRKACEIASYIREFAGKQVRVGATTDEIDKIVHAEILRLDVYPSPLGYYGFPKSICTSVNNVICHGIPDLRPLENGDIINIDVSVYVDGYHGDCSAMFVAGEADAAGLRLIQATRESLNNAIGICAPNVRLNAIGHEVQKVADHYGYGVVPAFTGHGIGHDFHMAPHIFHYENNYPGLMVEGMVFTIEPMLNETIYGTCVEHTDHWTMLTVDGARSAQFEQTLVITSNGVDIMTKHTPGYFDKK